MKVLFISLVTFLHATFVRNIDSIYLPGDPNLTFPFIFIFIFRFSTGSPLTYDWLESVLQMNESPPKTFEQLAELERVFCIILILSSIIISSVLRSDGRVSVAESAIP